MATAATPAMTPTTESATGPTTNWAPTAKVSVGALAGAGTTLIVGLFKGSHPSVFGDAGIVAAITSVLTFIIQYLVPERN